MITLNITGTLGKYGYSQIPETIVNDILLIATKHAYVTAYKKAPYLPEHPVHIKDEMEWDYDEVNHVGTVKVALPYALIAEFGSKHRIAHPYIRPAASAARAKMKAIIRTSTKTAITKAKGKA